MTNWLDSDIDDVVQFMCDDIDALSQFDHVRD